jgi:hypothetical protein
MYINAQVLNCQFELNYIHLGLFSFPSVKFGQRNNLQNFIFIYSNISISHPPESKQFSTLQGETQSSYPCPLSRPAALDISHQSRPNRGGAC